MRLCFSPHAPACGSASQRVLLPCARAGSPRPRAALTPRDSLSERAPAARVTLRHSVSAVLYDSGRRLGGAAVGRRRRFRDMLPLSGKVAARHVDPL